MENNEEKICPHCGAVFTKQKLEEIANSDEWKCTIEKEVSPEHWKTCYFCDTDLVRKDNFSEETLNPEAVSYRQKKEKIAKGLKSAITYFPSYQLDVFCVIITIIMTIASVSSYKQNFIIFLSILFFTIPTYLFTIVCIYTAVRDYILMKKDPDSYNKYMEITSEKKKQEEKQKSKEREEAIIDERLKKYMLEHPQCPTCGGYDTHKISLTARTVSAGLIGVASPYVGKTFECNDCGYKW